jgi:hypothetical protein
LAILTNVLSLFWVIGGEAWFENSYLYSTSSTMILARAKKQIDTSTSEMETSFYTSTQQADYELEEPAGSTHLENVFQYIAQGIKELFQLITNIFS